jgi:hypothetical protein
VIDSNGDPVTSTLITYRFQPRLIGWIMVNDAGHRSTDANGGNYSNVRWRKTLVLGNSSYLSSEKKQRLL